MPLVFARASVWQEPHLATNACLPVIRLAFSAPLTEQPAVHSASRSNTVPVPPRRPRLRGFAPAGTAVVEAVTCLMSGRNTIRRAGYLGAPPQARRPPSRLSQS